MAMMVSWFKGKGISSWHECEPSLEFRMNMTTGVNEARYMVNDGVNVEDNLERLQESINAATRVASEGDKCHGHALVLQKPPSTP